MIEADYTRNVHDRIDQTKVKVWKIKDDFQGGVPDAAYFAIINDEMLIKPPHFIEYKFLKTLPKREKTLIIPDLTKLQEDWLQTLETDLLEPWVIVGFMDGRKAKGVIYKNSTEWIQGISRTEFLARAQGYDEIAMQITRKTLGL